MNALHINKHALQFDTKYYYFTAEVNVKKNAFYMKKIVTTQGRGKYLLLIVTLKDATYVVFSNNTTWHQYSTLLLFCSVELALCWLLYSELTNLPEME